MIRQARAESRLGQLTEIGVITAVGVLGVMTATRFGMGISNDSLGYLIGARDIQSWGATQPPGLPILLSFGITLGIDPLSWMRAVNVCSAVVTVLVVLQMLKDRGVNANIRWGTGLALIAGSGILFMASYVLTEMVFTAIVMATLLTAERTARTRGRRLMLAVCAVTALAASALALRYTGIALIPAALAAISPGLRSASRRQAATAVAVYLLGTIGLIAAWAARNVAGGNLPFGRASEGIPDMSLAAVAVTWTKTMAGWIVSPDLETPLRQGLLVIAAIMIGTVIYAARASAGPLIRGNIAPLLFVAAFLLLTAVAAASGRSSPAYFRLFGPVLPPLSLIMAHAMHEALQSGSLTRPARIVIRVGMTAVAAVMVVGGTAFAISASTSCEAREPTAMVAKTHRTLAHDQDDQPVERQFGHAARVGRPVGGVRCAEGHFRRLDR